MKQPDLTIYVYFVDTWAMIYASRNILLVLPWVIDLLNFFEDYNYKCNDFSYLFEKMEQKSLEVIDSPGFGIIDLESDQS